MRFLVNIPVAVAGGGGNGIAVVIGTYVPVTLGAEENWNPAGVIGVLGVGG